MDQLRMQPKQLTLCISWVMIKYKRNKSIIVPEIRNELIFLCNYNNFGVQFNFMRDK